MTSLDQNTVLNASLTVTAEPFSATESADLLSSHDASTAATFASSAAANANAEAEAEKASPTVTSSRPQRTRKPVERYMQMWQYELEDEMEEEAAGEGDQEQEEHQQLEEVQHEAPEEQKDQAEDAPAADNDVVMEEEQTPAKRSKRKTRLSAVASQAASSAASSSSKRKSKQPSSSKKSKSSTTAKPKLEYTAWGPYITDPQTGEQIWDGEWDESIPNTVAMQHAKRETSLAIHRLWASSHHAFGYPPIQTRVAILGAGVAGLVAALQLVKRGIRVIIIEARPRIGGRIMTMKWDEPAAVVEETTKTTTSKRGRVRKSVAKSEVSAPPSAKQNKPQRSTPRKRTREQEAQEEKKNEMDQEAEQVQVAEEKHKRDLQQHQVNVMNDVDERKEDHLDSLSLHLTLPSTSLSNNSTSSRGRVRRQRIPEDGFLLYDDPSFEDGNANEKLMVDDDEEEEEQPVDDKDDYEEHKAQIRGGKKRRMNSLVNTNPILSTPHTATPIAVPSAGASTPSTASLRGDYLFYASATSVASISNTTSAPLEASLASLPPSIPPPTTAASTIISTPLPSISEAPSSASSTLLHPVPSITYPSSDPLPTIIASVTPSIAPSSDTRPSVPSISADATLVTPVELASTVDDSTSLTSLLDAPAPALSSTLVSSASSSTLPSSRRPPPPTRPVFPIDLGAAFLHGLDPDGLNPVYEYLRHRTSLVVKYDTNDIVYSRTGAVIPQKKVEKAWEWYERIDRLMLQHSITLSGGIQPRITRKRLVKVEEAVDTKVKMEDVDENKSNQVTTVPVSAAASSASASNDGDGDQDNKKGEKEEELECHDVCLGVSFELATQQLNDLLINEQLEKLGHKPETHHVNITETPPTFKCVECHEDGLKRRNVRDHPTTQGEKLCFECFSRLFPVSKKAVKAALTCSECLTPIPTLQLSRHHPYCEGLRVCQKCKCRLAKEGPLPAVKGSSSHKDETRTEEQMTNSTLTLDPPSSAAPSTSDFIALPTATSNCPPLPSHHFDTGSRLNINTDDIEMKEVKAEIPAESKLQEVAVEAVIGESKEEEMKETQQEETKEETEQIEMKTIKQQEENDSTATSDVTPTVNIFICPECTQEVRRPNDVPPSHQKWRSHANPYDRDGARICYMCYHSAMKRKKLTYDKAAKTLDKKSAPLSSSSNRQFGLDSTDIELLNLISTTQHAYCAPLSRLSLSDLKTTYEIGVIGGDYALVSPDSFGYSALINELRTELLTYSHLVEFRLNTEVNCVEYALCQNSNSVEEDNIRELALMARKKAFEEKDEITVESASSMQDTVTSSSTSTSFSADAQLEYSRLSQSRYPYQSSSDTPDSIKRRDTAQPWIREFGIPEEWLATGEESVKEEGKTKKKTKRSSKKAAAVAAKASSSSPPPPTTVPPLINAVGSSTFDGLDVKTSKQSVDVTLEYSMMVQTDDEEEFAAKQRENQKMDAAPAAFLSYETIPATPASASASPSSSAVGVRLHTSTIEFDEVTHEIKRPSSSSSSASSAIIEAEYCLVTASLGVLQSNIIQFSPPLPSSKQKAINSLGMGCENKVVLQFQKCFWQNDNTSSTSFMNPDSNNSKHYLRQLHEHRYKFLNLHAFGIPNVLVAQAPPPHSYQLSKLTDQEVLNECLSILKRMYPRCNLPALVRWRITRWHDDPYARGSYSFIPQHGSTADIKEYAAPCGGGTLYFAGEGAHPTDGQTVQGAFITGANAAAQIAKHTLTQLPADCFQQPRDASLLPQQQHPIPAAALHDTGSEETHTNTARSLSARSQPRSTRCSSVIAAQPNAKQLIRQLIVKQREQDQAMKQEQA